MILVPESDEAALEQVEFKLRQNVLALFPGTTCFYSAVVMSTPSRVKMMTMTMIKGISSNPLSHSSLETQN